VRCVVCRKENVRGRRCESSSRTTQKCSSGDSSIYINQCLGNGMVASWCADHAAALLPGVREAAWLPSCSALRVADLGRRGGRLCGVSFALVHYCARHRWEEKAFEHLRQLREPELRRGTREQVCNAIRQSAPAAAEGARTQDKASTVCGARADWKQEGGAQGFARSTSPRPAQGDGKARSKLLCRKEDEHVLHGWVPS
jgi:hypothetical protein